MDIVQNQNKPLIFVVNSATARARITGETAIALSQHGTVAPVTMHHRVDFAASMIDGRTVGEANPSGRSAGEVTQLWAYLDERLMRLRGDTSALIDHPSKTFEESILSPVPQALSNLQRAGKQAAEAAIAHSETPQEPPAQPSESAHRFGDVSGDWDGVERRVEDRGPPPGRPERRQLARQPFGRRLNASG